jgi:hypothetical protein
LSATTVDHDDLTDMTFEGGGIVVGGGGGGDAGSENADVAIDGKYDDVFAVRLSMSVSSSSPVVSISSS